MKLSPENYYGLDQRDPRDDDLVWKGLDPVSQSLFDVCAVGEDPLRRFCGYVRLTKIEISTNHGATEAQFHCTDITDIGDEDIENMSKLQKQTESSTETQAGLTFVVVHERLVRDETEINNLEVNKVKQIFAAFRLPTTILYPFSCYQSSFGTDLGTDSSAEVKINHFSDCYGFRLIWQYNARQERTTAVLVHPKRRGGLTAYLIASVRKLRHLADQPAFLGTAVCLGLTRGATELCNGAIQDEMNVEYWSGGKTFLSNQSIVADKSALGSLSGDTASRSIRIGFGLTTIHAVRQLVAYLLEQQVDLEQKLESCTWTDQRKHDGFVSISRSLRELDQQAVIMNRQLECLRNNASVQLSMLFNKIAEKDQELNIEIAEASRALAQESRKDQAISIEIARISKKIALETKRDSSSMKTIAGLTMAYLPATFVAAVFSMPIFDWNAQESQAVVSRQIWIYFVVTIPLTVITFGLWLLWYRRNQVIEEKENIEVLQGEKG